MFERNSKWPIRIYPRNLPIARLLEKFTPDAVRFSRNGKHYLELRADNFNCTREQKRRLLDTAYGLLDDLPDSIVKLRFKY